MGFLFQFKSYISHYNVVYWLIYIWKPVWNRKSRPFQKNLLQNEKGPKISLLVHLYEPLITFFGFFSGQLTTKLYLKEEKNSKKAPGVCFKCTRKASSRVLYFSEMAYFYRLMKEKICISGSQGLVLVH